MKKLTFLVFAVIAVSASAQTAKYGEIDSNGFYDSYITKAGNTINIGDTLVIGSPSGNDHFLYIQQGGVYVAPKLAGDKIEVVKIKSYGNKKRGRTLFIQFKGYGMAPVFIDYENALNAGEVVNPGAMMTKEEAIAKLKEAKDLLDLEVISQEEYDRLKKELTPIIIN